MRHNNPPQANGRNRNRRPPRHEPTPTQPPRSRRNRRRDYHSTDGLKFSCDAAGPCHFLAPFIDSNPTGMTLSETLVLNIKQPVGKAPPRFIGYCLRKKRKDKGMMISFCPFCGADYRPLFDNTGEIIPHTDAEEAEARLSADAS